MDTFVAQIPIPSMGATVHELTLIDLDIEPGDSVEKGQKCAEFESDKSAFDFEFYFAIRLRIISKLAL